eukprot:SAG11_NODE_15955_length_561_cov_1.335498_2_plen_79_part_00
MLPCLCRFFHSTLQKQALKLNFIELSGLLQFSLLLEQSCEIANAGVRGQLISKDNDHERSVNGISPGESARVHAPQGH